ncbi:hypothetical protein HRI_003918200 [Hibiscus trionum]|uniref:Uncharacterized protein n=1 Tax=Hibiscus trionum TaxID=183268 RepID=A0A9W7IUY0_HIBTR|nr:hypothetical protein HRI_003918200 [Hibiscus trionum]
MSLKQSVLNVSNLLGAQAALLNPQLLILANTLMSLKQENPELVLQYLNQNQLCNSQAPIQDTSACTTSAVPSTSMINQTGPMQATGEVFTSNMTNFSYPNPNSQDNLTYSTLTNPFVGQPNSAVPILSENSNLQSLQDGNQNCNFDSVRSTPISSPTPLHSSPTYVNSCSTNEEIESFSSLFKFEIPEGLDINDFM